MCIRDRTETVDNTPPGAPRAVLTAFAYGDEAVAPYADHLIRLPAVPPLIQPLVAAVPLQVFACELATARGNDVDQPRNLAKSVTVE
ncbi:hypothetical protein ADL27_30765 [Streptomyces sp. NRRL F-6602]|nr:hypothetical protein ADL27_30765 [Streptomyces sp. NRRL F-6602]